MWQTIKVALCSCFIAQIIFTFKVHFLVLGHMMSFMSGISISCNNTLSMMVESKSCHMTRRDFWHKPDNVKRTSSANLVFLITLTGVGSPIHNRATIYSVGQPFHSKHNHCWCCFKTNTPQPSFVQIITQLFLKEIKIISLFPWLL